MSRLYSKNDQETLTFFQTPKKLYDNRIYSNISNGCKMMYSILRDRQDLSIKNDWIDDNGFIFFYYDCEKLAEYMSVSTSTINRYKKELIKARLMLQVRQGQGKPNRMYILKPESVDTTLNSHNDKSRIVDMTYLEVSKSLGNDTESKETKHNDTKYLHLFDEKTTVLLNLLNDFSIKTFGKPVRYHDPNNEYSKLEGFIEDFNTNDWLEVFERHLTKYDYCNLNYLNAIIEREI